MEHDMEGTTVPLAGPPATNQATRHTARMLALIRLLIERRLATAPGEGEQGDARLRVATAALQEGLDRSREAGAPLPDEYIAGRYALSQSDLLILWLAVAPHLDPDLRMLIARLNDNVLRDYADPALILRLLAGGEEAAAEGRLSLLGSMRPGAPLLRHGLLRLARRVEAGTREIHDELAPASHIVYFLGGVRALSACLVDAAELLEPTVRLSDLAVRCPETEPLRAVLHGFFEGAPLEDERFGPGGIGLPAGLGLVLRGRDGAGRGLAVKAIAAELGRRVLRVDGRLLAQASNGDAREMLEALGAEAELYGELVLIRNAEPLLLPGSAHASAVARVLRRRAAAVALVVDADTALAPELERVVVLDRRFTQATGSHALEAIWRFNLPPGELAAVADVDLSRMAAHIALSPVQVRKAAQLARILGASRSAEATGPPLSPAALLEQAARAQVSANVGQLAQESRPDVGLADVILPPPTEDQVRRIIAAVRNRGVVLRQWGIQRRIRRGIGICCLFDGEPGTGKTLAAEAIAGELELSLLRVNIASVVDKYIGETEKNLARIFERARPDTSLLLFDEADSLFSKRTEVTRSADRYSNMDINVLLQLFERYEGVVVLTTNLKRSIDKAFERRFSFKVDFPLPGPDERERIWRHLLPEELPTREPIDFEQLSEVEAPGGEIKNAIVAAAYAAAQDTGFLSTELLMEAALREAAASGRLVRSRTKREDDW